jgi:hypothetical protein
MALYGRARPPVFTSLALIGLAAAGCVPPSEEAVATVDGERVITAGDLKYYYERGLEAGAWSADADLRQTLGDVLDAAVNGKVLEIEAEKRGYADDPAFTRELAAAKSRALREYVRRRVEDAVVVTKAEVLRFYEKTRKRRMFSFVEVHNPARAEEAYEALAAGRPWEAVVAEYSTFHNYTGPGGGWDAPMEYSGDDVSEALFAVGVGEYTPPLESPDGLAWYIYRCDKIVHGSNMSFDEAEADVERIVRGRKADRNLRELVRGWRAAAPIKRDDGLWRLVFEAPFAEVAAEYGGKGVVLSDVGGVPVYFDEVLELVEKYLLLPPEEMDRMREEEPFRYGATWNSFLRRLEDEALLEYRALKEGVEGLPSFRREMAARRGDMLIDRLYREEFLSRVSEPTPEEVAAYYDEHKADFYTPERVEVYLAAVPDRAEAERFYGEIKAGADLVITGEARNRAREKAAQELYESPPPLPPEKREWLGVVAVTVDPALPNAPADPPLAAELRPRVFPFEKLNVLSEIFQLRDGRWAFYEPIFYQPELQRGLEDPEVAYFCRRNRYRITIESPEVSAAAEEWLRGMRARHEVVMDDEALSRVAAELERRARRRITRGGAVPKAGTIKTP